MKQKVFHSILLGWNQAGKADPIPGVLNGIKAGIQIPAQFVSDMLQKNIRLNLWINPYVSKYASFYNKFLPYTASHTVWNGVVPDFTMDSARTIFFRQLEDNQVAPGVSGYKIDEVDGYDNWLWPDVATFPGGHTRRANETNLWRFAATV